LDARELDLALVCCAFAWPRWLPAAVGHVWVNDRPGGASPLLFAALPWPEDRGVGLIPVRRAALDSEDSWMRWVQFCGRNEWVALLTRDTPFQSMARFHLRFGHAAAYGVPGAVLMGDAAHPVTPAGGQGANLSLADAAALAPLLTSRAASDEMIGEYERLRRPAAERSLSLSRRAGQALKLPDALIGRLLPIALALVGLRPKIFSPALRFVSSAFAGRESDAAAGLRPHHCGSRR
jgi:2-polyprenyl-6-methoxyphenol hydroxylase-like FAD-dependent oxidoreductase